MSADANSLTQFSNALTALVGDVAPSLTELRGPRSRFSGFVWRPGLVVTADEVMPDEGELVAAAPDGSTRAATVVGRDSSTDVALLRVEGLDAPSVALNAAPVHTGALALAIGAGPTAQAGLVAHSGPAWRSMRGGEIDARIELDLQLRRESEGGLVVDVNGRALGMAVFGPRRRALVIPAATIARVAELLERHGRVPRGYLGLALQPVRADEGRAPAVMVMSVDPAGPAAAAGIIQGDVVVGWNGEPPQRVNRLIRALGPDSVGRPLGLTLRRGSETVQVTITVAEHPDR